MKKATTKSVKKVATTRKTQKRNNTFEFGVFDLSVPPSIKEAKNIKNLPTDWVPFGDDNLFPQYLAELKRKSSTHRSVSSKNCIYKWGKICL